MSAREVEKILGEIRERVRSARLRQQTALTSANDPAYESPSGDVAASLERLAAHLVATERAKDKLPPLTTYRRGWRAQLELWMKRYLKRATHWFTFEQVSFNSAANSALSETLNLLRLLKSQQDELKSQQDELKSQQNELKSQQAEWKRHHGELRAQVMKLNARFESAQEQAQALVEDLSALALKMEALLVSRAEIEGRIDELRREMRERAVRLLDEQRASLRQLALEMSEERVAADRARRQTQLELKRLSRCPNAPAEGDEEARRTVPPQSR